MGKNGAPSHFVCTEGQGSKDGFIWLFYYFAKG